MNSGFVYVISRRNSAAALGLGSKRFTETKRFMFNRDFSCIPKLLCYLTVFHLPGLQFNHANNINDVRDLN